MSCPMTKTLSRLLHHVQALGRTIAPGFRRLLPTFRCSRALSSILLSNRSWPPTVTNFTTFPKLNATDRCPTLTIGPRSDTIRCPAFSSSWKSGRVSSVLSWPLCGAVHISHRPKRSRAASLRGDRCRSPSVLRRPLLSISRTRADFCRIPTTLPSDRTLQEPGFSICLRLSLTDSHEHQPLVVGVAEL